jgi:disulfide bond formation protein DsbB
VQYTSDDTGEPDGTNGNYSLSGDESGALGAATGIQLASVVTHTVQVGAHSQLKFTVKLPTSAKPGSTYTLKVNVGKFSDTQSIKIVGVAASAAAASLAPLWIVLVLALLIVLALIFFLTRRRRKVA